jgi:hypothetical protein
MVVFGSNLIGGNGFGSLYRQTNWSLVDKASHKSAI